MSSKSKASLVLKRTFAAATLALSSLGFTGNIPPLDFGNRSCAEIWDFCSPTSDESVVNEVGDNCNYEYQLCLGVEAYNAAMSLVHPPTVEERVVALREASFRLSRFFVFGLQAYQNNPIGNELWYLKSVVDDPRVADFSPGQTQDYLDDPDIDHQAVREETQDYFLSRALMALERYLFVTEQLVRLEMAQADAIATKTLEPSAEGVFAARKTEEFVHRSNALAVLTGRGAVLPPCLVDVENPTVALAVSALRETSGDIGGVEAVSPTAFGAINTAVQYIREDSLARSLHVADVQAGVVSPVLPGPALPYAYHRGTSELKTTRWMCRGRANTATYDPHEVYGGSTICSPDLYGDSLAPDFSSEDDAESAACFIDGLLNDFNGVSGLQGQRGLQCVPSVEAADGAERPLIGAMPLLEAVRNEMLTSGRYLPDGIDEVFNPSLDLIVAEIDEALGQRRVRWRPDVFSGRLFIETFEFPGPIGRFVVLGRDALGQLASKTNNPGGLTNTPLTLDGEELWPRSAIAVPNNDFASIFVNEREFPGNPIRNEDAWELVCESIFNLNPCNSSTIDRGRSFADDLFLLRERIPIGGLTEGAARRIVRPMTFYLVLVYEAGECPPNEICFELANGRQALVADHMSASRLMYSNIPAGISHHRGGSLEKLARRVIEREPDVCSEARFNSLGVAKRLVPPLENELNDNLDPFENSFKDYLARAKEAAQRAAALAIEAREIENTLENNRSRAEREAENLIAEATESVESICGAGAGEQGCFVGKSNKTIGDIGFPDGAALLPPAVQLLDLGEIDAPSLPICGADAICNKVEHCINDVFTATLPALPSNQGAGAAQAYADVLDVYRELAQCTALVIIERVRSLQIADLPDVFEDGTMSFEERAGFGGRYGITLDQIEIELLSFANSVIAIKTAMQALDSRLEGAKANVDSMITSESGRTANSLELVGQAIQGVGSAIGGITNPIGGFSAMFSIAGTALTTAARSQQLDEQYRQEEAQAESFVQTFIASIFEVMGDMKVGANTMEASASRLTSLIEELKLLELEQEHARARAERLIETLQAQVFDEFVWTTATRSNFQAHRAIERSKLLSYIARRSIEFRLVVDLSRETEGGALIEPPSAWADSIFVVESRAAELAPEDGVFEGLGVLDDPITLATTEYVERLEDYVAYYPFTHPFQGSTDTAVLSLKDDLVPKQFGCAPNGNATDLEGGQVPGPACTCTDPMGNALSLMPAAGSSFAQSCFDEGLALPGDVVENAVAIPYDFDGILLRQSFLVKCRNAVAASPLADAPCSPEDVEYYQIDFPVTLLDIESGNLASQGQIAGGRYNYRVDTVALNFVGTNVKDCTLPGSGVATCFGNAFIPFTLIHQGRVTLRDYDNDLHTYGMATARVQAGKALAAERFLTSPLADADASLIRQYTNTELRGRPMQGLYSLRILNQPSLAFDELQDVQILLTYRSWTAFQPFE